MVCVLGYFVLLACVNCFQCTPYAAISALLFRKHRFRDIAQALDFHIAKWWCIVASLPFRYSTGGDLIFVNLVLLSLLILEEFLTRSFANLVLRLIDSKELFTCRLSFPFEQGFCIYHGTNATAIRLILLRKGCFGSGLRTYLPAEAQNPYFGYGCLLVREILVPQ